MKNSEFDPETYYQDVINKRIDEEKSEKDEMFLDWLEDNGYLPKLFKKLDERTMNSIYDALIEDSVIDELYYFFRKDSIIEECLANAAQIDSNFPYENENY